MAGTREAQTQAQGPTEAAPDAPIEAFWGKFSTVFKVADDGLAWLAGIDTSREQDSEVATKSARRHPIQSKLQLKEAGPWASNPHAGDAAQLLAIAAGHCEVMPFVLHPSSVSSAAPKTSPTRSS